VKTIFFFLLEESSYPVFGVNFSNLK